MNSALSNLKRCLHCILKYTIGDRNYERVIFRKEVGYWPNLSSPQTFSEKVCFRKLNVKALRFSSLADKSAVRRYVENLVGKDILNKVYVVTDRPDSIKWKELPDQFVMKPTHASALVYIHDGAVVDVEKIRKTAEKFLAAEFGFLTNEYFYKGIKPQIMIEEYIGLSDKRPPMDFKFFVFSGKVEFIQVDIDRFEEHTRTFYDRAWHMQNFSLHFPLGRDIAKPSALEKMIEIAETLAQNISFVRVDLYVLENGGIRFGEMAFTPGAGRERFTPDEIDRKFGMLWRDHESG